MTRRVRFTPLACTGVFAAMLGATTAYADAIPFAPAAPVALGTRTSFVSTADVDGDGDLDVLSGDMPPRILWWENTEGVGPQPFVRHIIATTISDNQAILSADVDRDGDADVLSVDSTTLAWYENLAGNGTSWLMHTVTTVAGATFADGVVGDVDGDGDLDVVTARFGAGVILFQSVANGASWVTRTLATAPGADSVAIADLDGDGDLDVTAGDTGGPRLLWIENLGSNLWFERTVSTALTGAFDVAIGDVDRDGDVDLLSTSVVEDVLVWLENTGGAAWPLHTIGTIDVPTAANAVDLDGDGDLDALAVSFSQDVVAWFENTAGDGSSWTARTVATGLDGPLSTLAADLDGDGDRDVVTASYVDSRITWIENLTIHQGACFALTPLISTTAAAAYSVAAADVDGDGDLDPLSASPDDNTVAWYDNVAGNGSAWTPRTISTVPDGALSVQAADVDGDGDVDALSASVSDDMVAWHENLAGNGTTWALRTISTAADLATSVFAGDVDGDGDTDALSASLLDDTVAWYDNVAGNGSTWTLRTISAATDGAVAVSAADVDGDGDLDALAAAIPGTVSWFENTAGNGSAWTTRTISAAAPGAIAVDAADVDGDGDMDVLSASYYDDKVAWYENTAGNGSAWTVHTITTAGDAAQSVRAADIDGDGDVDVLSTSIYDDVVAWHENTAGDGSAWIRHVVATNADWPASVAAADLDGDGDRDALSAARNSSQIAWYRNDGGQVALAVSDIAPPGAPNGDLVPMLRIAATHLGRTGDGDLELARLGLLLEEGPGDPLTTTEANAVIASLHVYRDTNGNGVFDPAQDLLVATLPTLTPTAGVQVFTLPDGNAGVQLGPGLTATFFVVAELTGNASTQVPNQFRITHLGLGPSASQAEDRAHDLPLHLACAANVPSSVLAATPVELMDFRIE